MVRQYMSCRHTNDFLSTLRHEKCNTDHAKPWPLGTDFGLHVVHIAVSITAALIDHIPIILRRFKFAIHNYRNLNFEELPLQPAPRAVRSGLTQPWRVCSAFAG